MQEGLNAGQGDSREDSRLGRDDLNAFLHHLPRLCENHTTELTVFQHRKAFTKPKCVAWETSDISVLPFEGLLILSCLLLQPLTNKLLVL